MLETDWPIAPGIHQQRDKSPLDTEKKSPAQTGVQADLEHHSIVVVAALVSPYAESREFVRRLCGNFIEIYVSTPLEECERRDVKGMYAKARRGEIRNFTGISDPYEPPLHPTVTIDSA